MKKKHVFNHLGHIFEANVQQTLLDTETNASKWEQGFGQMTQLYWLHHLWFIITIVHMENMSNKVILNESDQIKVEWRIFNYYFCNFGDTWFKVCVQWRCSCFGSLEAKDPECVSAGVKPSCSVRAGSALLWLPPILSLLQTPAGWTLQITALQTSEYCQLIINKHCVMLLLEKSCQTWLRSIWG